MRLGLQYIYVLCFLCACREKSCYRPHNVTAIKVSLRVERLEDDIFHAKTPADIQALLAQHPDVAEGFFDITQYPSQDLLAAGLFKTFQNPHTETLYNELSASYGDFANIVRDFKRAFQHILHHYPDFEVPEIKTVISGLYKDLYFSHDVLVVGLDYFIGPKATYKPAELPNYMLQRYTPNHVVPTALMYISNRYNKINPADKTLLADMIAAGKTFYFVQSVFPCLADEMVIGYTQQQWRDVVRNESIIWENFVRNQWFYTQSERWKQKLVGERPNVPEIGNRCPGRIGGWLGWRIVEAYMERHTQVTLPALMAESNTQKIFIGSGYSPR